MVNVLLKRIKELEEKLEIISEQNEEVKNQILQLFKQCKIDKNFKEQFKKNLIKTLNKLEAKKEEKFFNDNYLEYDTFIEIIQNISNGYLIIINANYNENIKKFILGFLLNKISPFFTLDNDLIIGVIDEKKSEEIKKINTIPYFNPQKNEYKEIELKKIIFDLDNFNYFQIKKAKKIFYEFQKRPSYRKKHYIEYSLIKDKIVDFEKEKLNKEKEKYEYVYEEQYPILESKLKREIKNIPFVLAVLERIDKELEEIKQSKGIINIVNRMLNYIELNVPELREEVKVLRNKLRE